ncbi:MAG: hypothetical protein AB1689_28150 [Thermodesulfobacteriota bacterium]
MMVFARWMRLAAVGVVLAAAVGACSGDDFEPGETVYTGIIVVPPEQQCAGCRGSNVQAQLLELGQDQAPRIVKCVTTNERGIYDTSGPNTCPEMSDGTLPPGDGQQTVIVVAIVNERGGQIGGLVSSRLGSVTSTDFNGTTHVACKAGVFLTAGTASFGDPGCVVQASCPSGLAGCFPTLAPNDIDDARINTLEEAGEMVEAQVDFTEVDGVDRASCAVIVCTQAGAVPATQECLQQQLAS